MISTTHYHQVRKSSAMLEEVAAAIGGTLLIDLAEFEGVEPMEISDVYDVIERQVRGRGKGGGRLGAVI